MFKKALADPSLFCINWEQVPGRGSYEKQQEEIISNTEKAIACKKIHSIAVTDNPGGNPAISVEFICSEIKKMGIDPLVHFSCRDKNRNEIESLLYGLERNGLRNLLVVTGDFPSPDGFSGTAKPVFDLDPVHLLQLISAMNNGLEYKNLRKMQTLAKTEFIAGVGVSPFKIREAELMGQYYKLKKKIDAGAAYIIPQIGYDMRKLHELIQWLKINDYHVPVMANLYVMSCPTARVLNSGQIPGAVVTDKLLARLEEERKAPDKGVQKRIERAAKMFAISKGLGCAGAHIGGHGLKFERVEEIIDMGEAFAEKWESYLPEFDFPQENGFYLFEKDEKTGLNSDIPAVKAKRPAKTVAYAFSTLAHSLFFDPKSPLFPLCRQEAKIVERFPLFKKMYTWLEHLTKVALFHCQDCGDCALTDTAYLCPMSQCPKGQRNGPCGGSHDGWCEVYPEERQCVWVRAYERLKSEGKEDGIGENLVPPCDWQLWQTSSWLNFYGGRDHTGKKLKEGSSEKS